MSKRWDISSRGIALLCEWHRADGVIKKVKTRLIPYNALKPEDARKITVEEVR